MNSPAIKIKIGGVPEHFNYPWHQGIQNGLFEKQNIRLEWQDMPGGTGQMSEALENGELDLAIMLTEGCLLKINQGSPIQVLQQYIASPLFWGIYVHPDNDITRNDLAEKTAAISRFGSGSHLMAIVNAKQNDWPTNKMNFHKADNLNGAIQSIHDGKADYFLWEHFMTKPFVDRGQLKFLGDCPTPWPCFVIGGRTDFVDQHQKKIKILLQSINQITKKFKNQESIVDFLANEYGLKTNDIKEWLKVTEWSQQQISESAIEKVQHYLKAIDLIEKPENPSFYTVDL